MTKNAHSKFIETFLGQKEFFPTIFPKKTGINLEWPKMAVPNFFQQFSQKDWYKFGMAKNGHSKFS